MRRSSFFFLWLGLLAVLFGLMLVHSFVGQNAMRPVLLEKKQLVRDFGLTDLCLATEANYTRHISQADFTTAFQDHPISLEHFPSGTWLRPNRSSGQRHGQLGRTAEKHP